MKKLYLVYREVIAKDIVDATKQKGKIYQISLASDEAQLSLLTKKQLVGFTNRLKKQND